MLSRGTSSGRSLVLVRSLIKRRAYVGGELSARVRLVQQRQARVVAGPVPGRISQGKQYFYARIDRPRRRGKLIPVHPFRHHDITENQIDAPAAAQDFERVPAVGRRHDVIAEPADRLQRNFQNAGSP